MSLAVPVVVHYRYFVEYKQNIGVGVVVEVVCDSLMMYLDDDQYYV